MELDNLIYIIIAIVLAIVNAVAQKKKKAAGQRPISSQPTPTHYNEPAEYAEEEPFQEAKPITEVPTNPFELLFGQPDINKVFTQVEEIEEQEIVDELEEYIPEEGVPTTQPSDYEQKLQEKAKQLMDFSHDTNIFDFEKDSIANSAIGDALTEEEEAQALIDNRNEILSEFSGAKAVIYSEILKPKYFSAGVNN
ncbi:MAG: hypothetical protein RBT74_03100 [Tenuifilaceae bacterium]|jgi:hypothetical protein|nr:hypothetical protein [Tenuifilaceae bacterium]